MYVWMYVSVWLFMHGKSFLKKFAQLFFFYICGIWFCTDQWDSITDWLSNLWLTVYSVAKGYMQSQKLEGVIIACCYHGNEVQLALQLKSRCHFWWERNLMWVFPLKQDILTVNFDHQINTWNQQLEKQLISTLIVLSKWSYFHLSFNKAARARLTFIWVIMDVKSNKPWMSMNVAEENVTVTIPWKHTISEWLPVTAGNLRDALSFGYFFCGWALSNFFSA